MKTKLIVMSADAFVSEDIMTLAELPNFKRYLAGGACIKQVRSIYPTCTYPCHTTMCTGVWPEKHGVVCNYKIVPGEYDPPYEWYHDAVKWDEDIFKAAKAAGYTTAAVSWPVSGNHPYIDYLMAECWPKTADETFIDSYRKAGSNEKVIDIVKEELPENGFGATPDFERFQMRCAAKMIKKYKPDVLFLHPGNIDGYRHKYGVFNEHVTKGIHEIDEFIGIIMEAVNEAGLSDITDFVLTSDHGQINVERYVSPNVKLVDAGLIDMDENGNMTDWKAYCMTNGSSALIYLKDKNDKETYDKTYNMFKHMVSEEVYGFSRIYTEEESRRELHFGGDFSFVLETDGYTAYNLRRKHPYLKKPDFQELKYARGQHGHSPDIGTKPVFYAKGPSFKENAVLDTANLIDEAPTFAKILDAELKNADGIVLNKLLK